MRIYWVIFVRKSNNVMTKTPHKITFVWEQIHDLWPHLDAPEGVITRLNVMYEESYLLIGSVLREEGASTWRTSLLLGEMRHVTPGFSSHEEARQAAEQEILTYVSTQGLLAYIRSDTTFEFPFHDVAAQLSITLPENMLIVYISQYRKEWFAVCTDADGVSLEDYAFQRDSDGILSTRPLLDRFHVSTYGKAQTLAAKAHWFAELTLPSPHGEVKLCIYQDATTRRYFGLDSSFLEQAVADTFPNPYLDRASVVLNDDPLTPVETLEVPIQLTEAQLASQPLDYSGVEKKACFVGQIILRSPESDNGIHLELFEYGGLLAIELDYLERGPRTVNNVYSDDRKQIVELPQTRNATLRKIMIEANVTRLNERYTENV